MTGISFVIPARNEEIRVGRCVRSIKAELLRAGLVLGINAEIIVVDNGSTDATSHVAAVNGAKVIREPRPGVSRARQTGYEHSHYELIANIDADCMLRSGWMAHALYALRDPRITALSGPVRYFDLPLGKHLAAAVFGIYGLCSRFGWPIMMAGNSIFRRSALEAVGGYNTDIEFWGDDTWMAVACSKHGKVKFDFRMVVDASGRRLVQDGYLRTFARYLLNHFAIRINGKPVTKGRRDHR